MKNNFKHLNIYINGGTEFFNRSIINEIIPYLNKLNIKYKVLNQYEINNLTRPNRPVQNIINKLKKVFTVENIRKILYIQPNNYQQDILNIIYEFYILYNIAKLIWSCGLGKTFMSLFIIQKCEFKNIIIGVNSIHMQEQFKKEILLLFPNKENILLLNGSININDI